MVTSFYKSVIGSCSRVRKVINSCCCTARQAPKTSGDQRTRRFISQIIKTILSTLLKSLFILVAEVHVRMNCRRSIYQQSCWNLLLLPHQRPVYKIHPDFFPSSTSLLLAGLLLPVRPALSVLGDAHLEPSAQLPKR